MDSMVRWCQSNSAELAIDIPPRDAGTDKMLVKNVKSVTDMGTLRWTVGSLRSASFGCSAEAKFTLDTTGSLPKARQRVESSHCRIRIRFQTSTSYNLLLKKRRKPTLESGITRVSGRRNKVRKSPSSVLTGPTTPSLASPTPAMVGVVTFPRRPPASVACRDPLAHRPLPVRRPGLPGGTPSPPVHDAQRPSHEQTQGSPPFRTFEPTTDNSSSS